ncbi:hypothetical protein [Streptomyces sp. NRRL S-31]|uniref:hypothetical protein n=1 Tax=Streptomyces sp. NRRL S-31 TaxID=1463898 RepID=UPI0004C4CF63|nr:hypothetical protein [Streptomyces sp. NRRL S-31]
MNGNQAPRTGQRSQSAFPEEHPAAARTADEPALWAEELPWLDDPGPSGQAPAHIADPAGQAPGHVGDPAEQASAPARTTGPAGQARATADTAPAPEPGLSDTAGPSRTGPPPGTGEEPDVLIHPAPRPGRSGRGRAESRPARRRRRTAIVTTFAGAGLIATVAVLSTRPAPPDEVSAAPMVPLDPATAPAASPESHTAPSSSPSSSPSPSSSTASPTTGPTGTPSADPSATASPTHPSEAPSHTTAPARPPSGSPAAPAPGPATTPKPYVVRATTVLGPGDSVSSGKATLAMTAGGNFVVTDEHGAVRWASHTSGSGLRAVFQDDGNLAVYTAQGAVRWSSRTDGHPGAVLVVGADGNVQIRQDGVVLWQTGTGH